MILQTPVIPEGVLLRLTAGPIHPTRRARRRGAGSLGILLLGAALLAGAEKTGPLPQAPPRPPAGQAPGPGASGVSGAYAYRTYCASCHGADGKGDGPLAVNLRFQPPDLTLIAKRNGNEFPAEKIQRIVDGRKPLAGHGGPDMPIWGDAFRNAETGYEDARVKEKIRLVVEYLRTLQATGR
jgi:mono/diheme cytochrome c family protein